MRLKGTSLNLEGLSSTKAPWRLRGERWPSGQKCGAQLVQSHTCPLWASRHLVRDQTALQRCPSGRTERLTGPDLRTPRCTISPRCSPGPDPHVNVVVGNTPAPAGMFSVTVLGTNTMCPDVLCSPGCPRTASTAGRAGQRPCRAAAQKVLIAGTLGPTAPIGPVLALVFLLFQSPEACPDGLWGPGMSEINLYKYFTNTGYSSGLWVAKRRHVPPTPSVSPDPHAASHEETFNCRSEVCCI